MDERESNDEPACVVEMHRSHTYRLYPNMAQQRALSSWVGAVRFVYNLALEQRRDWWRPGRSFNYITQGREVTVLRAEVEWIRDVPSDALTRALRDLDLAYRHWWSGRSSAPTPRKKFCNDSFRIHGRDGFSVSHERRSVRLPKIGWIKCRGVRPIPGDPREVTINRRAGIWTATIQYRIAAAPPPESSTSPIGIDRGVAVFAALSDGSTIASVNHGKHALPALARAQRALARKKKGSNNRRKAVRRVARLHARVAAARKDFLHKASTEIAKNHGVVVLEKLEVRNMVRSAAGTVEKPGKNVRQKAGLNRAILDQGWGMFRSMLAYKLEERGARLIEVDPAYTSQTCSECGVIDAASRRSQAQFTCTACGHGTNADLNAAINILRRGTACLPVEASTCEADEAGIAKLAFCGALNATASVPVIHRESR